MKSTELANELKTVLGVSRNDQVLAVVKQLAGKRPPPVMLAIAIDPDTGQYWPLTNARISAEAAEESDQTLTLLTSAARQLAERYTEARLQLARATARPNGQEVHDDDES